MGKPITGRQDSNPNQTWLVMHHNGDIKNAPQFQPLISDGTGVDLLNVPPPPTQVEPVPGVAVCEIFSGGRDCEPIVVGGTEDNPPEFALMTVGGTF